MSLEEKITKSFNNKKVRCPSCFKLVATISEVSINGQCAKLVKIKNNERVCYSLKTIVKCPGCTRYYGIDTEGIQQEMEITE